MISNTLLGNNFRLILYKCGLNRNMFVNEVIDAKTICDKMVGKWKQCRKNVDIQLGCHIQELVQRRDSLEPWILTKTEIQSVIDMFALS